MGPFIIIGLAIYLIAIVISVIAFPFICSVIVINCKKFKTLVTGFLLLLTIALYLFACTALEDAFDNWCYSLYVGIALTPVTLACMGGLDNPNVRLKKGETPKQISLTAPILCLLTSVFLGIEGGLRRAQSVSAHMILNNVSYSSGEYGSEWYYDDFQYAGILLLTISSVSALFIGWTSFLLYRDYKHKLEDEKERKVRINASIERITQVLKRDCGIISSYPDSHQAKEVIQFYQEFCQRFIYALQNSEEHSNLSFKYGYFNNVNAKCETLIITSDAGSYYLYPVGIVVWKKDDTIRYIPIGRTTFSVSSTEVTKKRALPKEVHPKRHFWLHARLDGSPDLRFNNNPKLYVYEQWILNLDELRLHIYHNDIAKTTVYAYTKMFSQLSHVIELQRCSIKEIVHEENSCNQRVPDDHVELVKRSETTSPNNNENTTDGKQYDLEGCLYDILCKHGINILKDRSLVNVICSQYKIDIAEYKEIMEKMAEDDVYFQFVNTSKQNDFTIYNISNSFARENNYNIHRCLYIIQAIVSAIRKHSNSTD